MHTKLRSILFLFLLLSLGVGLIYFSFLGYYTRYWQDDWCYNADFQRLGVFGTLKGYYYITTYASNRFSLTLFSGLFYYLGIFGVQILPGIVILSLSISSFWLINNVLTILKQNTSKYVLSILSIALIFFTVYLAPDRFQSFYWRSAILPYTFPLIFFIFLSAIITSKLIYPDWNDFIFFILVLVLSFFGSGFSEAGGAFIFTGLTLILILCIWQRKITKVTNNNLMIGTILGLISSLSALIIEFLSPANTPRQISYAEPSTIIETITFSFKFGIDFLIDSFKSFPLPHLIFIVIVFCVSYLTNFKKDNFQINYKKTLKFIGSILISSVILLIAMQAPSAYVEGNPPAPRTLVIARWIVLFCALLITWLIADYLSCKFRINILFFGVSIILFISTIYNLRAIYQTYEFHQPRFEKIAHVWDERDFKIKSEKAKGINVINVQAIDSQFLGGGILELYPQPNWVNLCAADFYQVEKILATIDW